MCCLRCPASVPLPCRGVAPGGAAAQEPAQRCLLSLASQPACHPSQHPQKPAPPGDRRPGPAAQNVEMITPTLRRVNQAGRDVLETLQVPPLPPVEQPEGGHRVIYHIITGAHACPWTWSPVCSRGPLMLPPRQLCCVRHAAWAGRVVCPAARRSSIPGHLNSAGPLQRSRAPPPPWRGCHAAVCVACLTWCGCARSQVPGG